MPTIELTVTGKVQGVFYRDSTRKKASELGIGGWVRNEPDSSVTVRASGTESALAALERWCAIGPEKAEVKSVIRKNLPEESFASFIIIR